MVLCGTKNGSSMASLEEPFEAPIFLRVESNKWSFILLPPALSFLTCVCVREQAWIYNAHSHSWKLKAYLARTSFPEVR